MTEPAGVPIGEKSSMGCDAKGGLCTCEDDVLVPLSGGVWECSSCGHPAANDALRDLLRAARANPLGALGAYAEGIAARATRRSQVGKPLKLTETEEGTLRALARLALAQGLSPLDDTPAPWVHAPDEDFPF